MKIYSYNDRANICGTQIRILRKQKKLSQEELAARLQVAGVDLDQKAISRIECEKRFLADSELRGIAGIYQFSMDELAGRKGVCPAKTRPRLTGVCLSAGGAAL